VAVEFNEAIGVDEADVAKVAYTVAVKLRWIRRGRALAPLLALVLASQAHFTGARPSRPNKKSAVAAYTVRRGDNLTQVASKTGVSVLALARANRITRPDHIRPGQVLTIPRGLAAAAATAPAPGPASPVLIVSGDRIHRVGRGQTLAGIARQYRMNVRDLARANGIRNRNRIRLGQLLRVPGPPWLCPVRPFRGARLDFADSWGQARPGGRRHMGTDLFAFRGTPVVANVGGHLEHRFGSIAGKAYYLRGDDGNSYYGAHLDALLAPPGRIERGATIGTVGSTGNAEGTTPHLHFEIKPGGGTAVNPYPTLRRWC
jgi:murein DD-endopeptidase MepM/ murein hydrolase activator NlpD